VKVSMIVAGVLIAAIAYVLVKFALKKSDEEAMGGALFALIGAVGAALLEPVVNKYVPNNTF